MRVLFSLLIITACLLTSAQEEKKGNIFTNAGDGAKMVLAKQKFYGGNVQNALSIYREVEANNPRDAEVKYHIGLCYFTLAQMDNARETLEKALEINKGIKADTYFLLGRIYHKQENIDKAIENFKTFLALPDGDSDSKKESEVYLLQCQNAKQLFAAPLDVVITNLGAGINSKFDDKNPCVTADGKQLVFTTRRPENLNAPVDVEGDGKYFENIYLSNLDSASKAFNQAHALDNHVNTDAHDACTSISPDGKQLFIYKNDINDKASRGGNVFVSKQLNGKWKTPEPLGKPINNTHDWEGGACVSPDGKRYFFSSERKGGFGGSDIWMVERKTKKEWGEPVNLGPKVNSAMDEAGMFLAPDGKTLFFCSNGSKSVGGYDVLRTVYENGQWTEAVNVGYPINTPAKEGQLTVSADARFAYISSDRKGGLGENDLYQIELKDYAILEKDGKKRSANGLSILKGTIREGFEGYGMSEVEVHVRDEKGQVVVSTSTNDNGEYFVTLNAGKYKLDITKKGYKEILEDFEIGASNKETLILEKGYLLKK